MSKDEEVVARLDRLIEIMERMTSKDYDSIKQELKEINQWRIETIAQSKTKGSLIEMVRWFGPWALAFLYVLFNHKIT